MSLINGTLIKLEPGDQFVYMCTYSRSHGRQGRFLIDTVLFSSWLAHGEGRYYENDIGHHLYAELHGNDVRIKLLWHHDTHDIWERYMRQEFTIPHDLLHEALDGKTVRYMSSVKPAKTILDFTYASSAIQKIMANKHKRRAFSKALRHSFQWAGSSITFYRDIPDSFFFEEKGGICGGFILHNGKKRTKAGEFPCFEYSVHT